MGLPSEVGGKAKHVCSWEPSEEDFQGGVISCVKFCRWVKKYEKKSELWVQHKNIISGLDKAV